jgi:hypothetical protein
MGTRLITAGTIDEFSVGEVSWVAGTYYRSPDFKLWEKGHKNEHPFVADRILGQVRSMTTPVIGTGDFEFKLVMVPTIGAATADEIDLMIGRVYEEAIIDTVADPDEVDWFLLAASPGGAFNEYFTMKDAGLVPSGSDTVNPYVMTLPYGRFVFKKTDHAVGDVKCSIWVAG